MSRFEKDVEVKSKVPTGSMADIAFLLLIFFMATTIFRIEQGLEVKLPRASMGAKLPRQNLAHIWVDRFGRVMIDDAYVEIGQIEPIMVRKVTENNRLIVAFNTDRETPYRVMDDAMEQLKRAQALSVAFNHDKRGGS